MFLPDLIRFAIYEYLDVCFIPKLYNYDRKLFGIIIKKYHKEREFSLVNLSFLKKNYINYEINTNEVILKGQIDCVKFLSEKRGLDSESFDCAVKSSGNLEIMKWLNNNNCPWDDLTVAYAAAFGNPEIMRWLKTNESWYKRIFRSIFSSRYIIAYAFAAAYGNIENMKWLRTNNYLWNKPEFSSVEKFGTIEHMKYVRVNNYFWNWMSFARKIDLNKIQNMKRMRKESFELNRLIFTYSYVIRPIEPHIEWLGEVMSSLKRFF
jgi:hypothetical protein